MAPGIPTEDEITAETKPSTRTIIASSSASRPTSRTTPSFQDRLEDIRDAVTETETYTALSKRTSAVYNSAATVWQLSRHVAWIVGTSALVLVIPLLYEIDKELGPGYEPPAAAGQSASSSSSASTSSTSDSVPSKPATDVSSATQSSSSPSAGDASLTKSPAST